MKIPLTETISIDEHEIQEEFVRAPGPGGQNVNKVSTAVRLRFDVRNSPSLADDIRRRLISISGKRMTDEGVLIISASRFRTQEQNRVDALDRLKKMVLQASKKPTPRRKTRPTLASQTKRVDEKISHGRLKRSREAKGDID
jgi:ribosome-associated protein